MHRAMSLVEPATDSDLGALLGWLETEYHEDSRKGFWLNRNGIEEKHRKYGELYVTRDGAEPVSRSEEHTSELQSLLRISYAVFCLKKKNHNSSANDNTTPRNYPPYN